MVPARSYGKEFFEIWDTWSYRQVMEHFPDALRQHENERIMQQQVQAGQHYKPDDWRWLDYTEQQWWCEEQAEDADHKPTQREMHERVFPSRP